MHIQSVQTNHTRFSIDLNKTKPYIQSIQTNHTRFSVDLNKRKKTPPPTDNGCYGFWYPEHGTIRLGDPVIITIRGGDGVYQDEHSDLTMQRFLDMLEANDFKGFSWEDDKVTIRKVDTGKLIRTLAKHGWVCKAL